ELAAVREVHDDRRAIQRVVREIANDDAERTVRVDHAGGGAHEREARRHGGAASAGHVRPRSRSEEHSGRAEEHGLANQTSHCCTSLMGENLLHVFQARLSCAQSGLAASHLLSNSYLHIELRVRVPWRAYPSRLQGLPRRNEVYW